MSEELEDIRAKIGPAGDLNDRQAMIDAIGAVRNLLHSHGLTFSETRPFLELMGALEDHRTGKPHPMLAVIGNAGNKAHTITGQSKAVAAAVVTLIARRQGENVRTARALVSKRLAEAGLVEMKVATWHHEISNDRAPDDVRASYRYYLDKMGDLDEVGVESALVMLCSSPGGKM